MEVDGAAKAASVRKRNSGGRIIQSVNRAVDILEALAASSDGLSLTEIAGGTGLNVSTCHHLLATLTERNFVGRKANTRKYVLGSRLGDLAESRLKQFDLVDAAMPELHRLNHVTQESVHLATIQGTELIILARLESKQAIRVGLDNLVTRSAAAHATAAGKAILAWLPEAEMVRVIGHGGFVRYTDATVATVTDLVEQLRLARRNGFAVENEEFEPGVSGVAAAVRDQNGAVVGSVGVAIPVMRTGGEHFEAVKRAVRDCGRKLSDCLGNQADGQEAVLRDSRNPGI